MESDDAILDLAGIEKDKPYTTEVITDSDILKDTHSEYDYGILVRIEKHHNQSHWTQTRVFNRDIQESYCDQLDCEFYGKRSSQGTCFSETDPDEIRFNHFLDYMEAQAESHLKFTQLQRPESDKEYIEELESEVVCHFMNWTSTIEECVRLRTENARLRNKLGIYK